MDYLKQIKQGNHEILRFLVGNSKELDSHQKSIWNRKEYKDTKSLIRDLIKKTKESPANSFKIGMHDKKNRTVNYTFRKRSDMQKLIDSGNLGSIDIEITNQDRQASAIKKFGTSS